MEASNFIVLQNKKKIIRESVISVDTAFLPVLTEARDSILDGEGEGSMELDPAKKGIKSQPTSKPHPTGEKPHLRGCLLLETEAQ